MMWNYLYNLWRSVVRPATEEAFPRDAGDVPSSRLLRDELGRLLDERVALKKAAASYREFDYQALVEQVHQQVRATDRRIAQIRHELRMKPPSRQG